MKKLLALLLAVVMVMSMVCFAGAENFTDAAEIDPKNTEAVTVLSEMKIIAGMGDGTFAPKGTLTRAQAAKIICYMLLGADKAEALAAADGKFTDVPASHWSNKYVNYCAEQGIAAGTGAGKFNPNGKLTGYAFGKMLLCGAAGFDAEKEGLTGSSWDKNTSNLLKKNALNMGATVNNKDMSREEACRLALNFLFYGEKEDPESTLAYKTFGATRVFGSNDKSDLMRPFMVYTTETADTCWDGTDLEVKASPVLTFHGGMACDKIVAALGGAEPTSANMVCYRNSNKSSESTLDGTPLVAGSTQTFVCAYDGVQTEFYASPAEDRYYCIQLGNRAAKITAVTDPDLAGDGSVIEHGSVTIECGGKTFTEECDLFTAEDVGGYAVVVFNGKGSWKNADGGVALILGKATVKTGTLDAEDGIKVGGKTYPVLTTTQSASQSIYADGKAYIAAGGSVGDTVCVVVDAQGVGLGITEP